MGAEPAHSNLAFSREPWPASARLSGVISMNDMAYRVLLDLVMVSDPWPLNTGCEVITDMLDDEAQQRGHETWIDAYHRFIPLDIQP